MWQYIIHRTCRDKSFGDMLPDRQLTENKPHFEHTKLSLPLSNKKLWMFLNYSGKNSSVSTVKVLIHVLCDFQVAVTQS